MEALDSGGVFRKRVQIREMKSRTVWFCLGREEQKDKMGNNLSVLIALIGAMVNSCLPQK